MSSTILKMAPNVPVAMKIRFVDVWPNDLSKNSGKGYGSQVSVKGDVGGQESIVYLKGFTNANIGQLENAGVIARDNYQHDPDAKYAIPVLNGDVTLVLDQPAGERYPKLKVTGKNGNGKPIAAQESDPPRKNVNAKEVPGGVDDSAYADSLVEGDSGVWGAMVGRYKECVAAAQSAWGDDTQADALVAAAATLFIQRCKAGI